MADEKMVTEREAVVRERNAFRACFQYINDRGYFVNRPSPFEKPATEVEHRIVERYPLPKTARQRVATDEFGVQWRIHESGAAEWRDALICSTVWDRSLTNLLLCGNRAAIVAGLLARPTEEVEDDGSAEDRT